MTCDGDGDGGTTVTLCMHVCMYVRMYACIYV